MLVTKLGSGTLWDSKRKMMVFTVLCLLGGWRGYFVPRQHHDCLLHIRCEMEQIGGRTVKVNFLKVPRGGEREAMGPKIRRSNKEFIESPHKIYAGKIFWIATSEKLKDALADEPGLFSAKVIYEKHSGRYRDFGFVTFSYPEADESALSARKGMVLKTFIPTQM